MFALYFAFFGLFLFVVVGESFKYSFVSEKKENTGKRKGKQSQVFCLVK